MHETSGPMGQRGFFSLHIPADLAEVSKARLLMQEIGRQAPLPQERVFDLEVCVSEAVANGIEHAASAVEIEAWVLPDRVIVEVTNDGVFQPGLVKTAQARRRGLGLPLMVSLADQVHVARLDSGKTQVSLTFFYEEVEPFSLSLGIQDRPHAASSDPSRLEASVWLTVPMLVVLAVVLYGLGLHAAHEYQPLLTAFNSFFLAAPLLMIAYLAGRSYVDSGSRPLVPLGIGALVLGIAYLIIGPVISVLNESATIHNGAILVAGACFALSAFWTVRGAAPSEPKGRTRIIIVSYLAALAFAAILVSTTLAGFTPAFFVPGQGYTTLRAVILGLGVVAVLVAATYFLLAYRRVRSRFLLWFCSGLALLGLAFAILLLARAPSGTAVSWLGRSTQWLAGLYLLVGILRLERGRGWSPLALEQALKETEDRYKSLVELSPDAILVDVEGKHVFANPAAARLLGARSPDELVGKDALEYVHPDDRDLLAQRISQVLGGSVTAPRELRLLRLDGTPVTVEVAGSRVQFGGKLANQAVVRDITERKRATEELQKSEERYRALFETMNEGFILAEIVTDDQGRPLDYRFLDVNPAGERYFGLSREELVGRTYKAIGGTNADPGWIELLSRVALTREAVSIERYAPVGGQWVNLAAYSPSAGRFAAIFTDITERKQAEEALRETTRRFQAVVDHAPLAIYIKDRDGRFVFGNRKLEDYTGHSVEHLLGMTDYDFAPGEDADRWRQNDLKVLEGQPSEYEETGVDRDGRAYVNISMKFPMSDESGVPVEICGISMDITERKQAEETLRESEERLSSVLSSSRDVIYRVNIETGEYDYISPSSEQVLGYTPDELKALTQPDAVRAMIHPDDVPAFREAIARSSDLGWAEAEWRQLTKSGEYRWLSTYFMVTKDEAGRQKYRTGTARDITERKRAEAERERLLAEELALVEDLAASNEDLQSQTEQLIASEQRYRSLFENMLDGFAYCQMLFDRDGRPEDFVYLAVNAAFEQLTGLTDVVGKRVTTVIPGIKEATPELFESYGRVAAGGPSERFEIDFTPLSKLLLVAVSSPAEGYFVAVFEDVTEQKEAQEALALSEERFRTMADAIPQLAWVAKPDGYIYWYNRRWYEYTGTTPAQMEGWGWQSVHDPQVLPGVLARWQQCIATGEPFDMEFPLRGVDGDFRMFLTRVMPQKDAQGGVLQWFGTNTDITERKQAEAALANSERSLAEAQHIGRIGSWEWNIQTGEVSWSPELYSLYQVDPDTFVPSIQAFGDYVHPDDRDYVDGIIGQILSGNAPGDFDFRIVLADGSTRYLNTTGQLTEWDEAGRPRLMVGVNQDVTERKRVEQTLLQLNRTLAAHSASDQALIRATDESSYVEEVCRIVVEVCGHAMVWIGYKEDNDDRSVRPVASAGFEEGYLEALNITWADSERGRGPTGTAVRTGRPSKCPYMLTDPTFAPWRDEAVKRGYASSIALPLLENETAFGAITIYSSEPDAFSDDEVKLLADLTDDLALGISTLRLRTAHAEAERERDILLAEEQHLTEELQAINEELQAQTEELQAQTEELQVQTEELAAREWQLREQNEELLASRYNRTLIEASLDPLVTIGLDGTITDVNEAAVKMRGYSREEIIGTDFSDYFTDPQKARLGYQEAFARGSVTDYPLTIRSRDGRLTDVLYNATVYRDESGKVQGVFAAARDITAIKELEVQREIASTLQEALLDIPEETSLVRFSHLYRSATRDASVGGDFYDVFQVKNDRMAVLIGDVSGHGVEAARVAILVKDVVHAFARQFSEPEMVLSKTNDLLLEKRIPGFVTVFLGILDPDTGVLKYSSAGHPPALLRTAEGVVQELAAGSAPVGVFPGHSWKDGQVQLHKGDLLLLYTDGLIEARRNGDFFGQEGLVKSLTRWKNPSPELLPQALLDEALSFSGGALSDDVAMLALSLRDIADDAGGGGA